MHTCTFIHYMYMQVDMFLMRDEKEASKVKQTNKAKQHSTPKAVTFPIKNELPQVGHVHVYINIHVYTVRTCIYMYMYTLYVHACTSTCSLSSRP